VLALHTQATFNPAIPSHISMSSATKSIVFPPARRRQSIVPTATSKSRFRVWRRSPPVDPQLEHGHRRGSSDPGAEFQQTTHYSFINTAHSSPMTRSPYSAVSSCFGRAAADEPAAGLRILGG